MPRVFDLIKPLDNRDTYAITDVIFQKGGLREVENISTMNSISTERRRVGMIVFIVETAEFYSLTGGDLTNDSWEKLDFSNNLENTLNIKEIITTENTNSISQTTGDNLGIEVTNTSILKIKNGDSLVSLKDINHEDGKLLFLQNLSENTITIKNNYFQTLVESFEIFNDIITMKAIAANNDKYVIVANDGQELSKIIYSTDMNEWTYSENIPDNNFEDIVFGDYYFVTVSSNGENRLMISEDGISWQQINVDPNPWQSITYGNNIYVAVASGGISRVMYSLDATTWNPITVEENLWKSVAFGAGIFVAVSSDGINRIMYSEDAISWTNIEAPTESEFFKIKFLNNKFYAISEENVIVSNDGINWEVLVLPFNSDNIRDIIFYDYLIFIKNNIIYYTDNSEIWKNFSFINTNMIYNSFFYENELYLICNNKILRIRLDIAIDNQYPILTGNNIDLPLFVGASVLLQFSQIENVWRVIGSLSRDLSILNLNDTPDNYPAVIPNNNIFLSLNSDENSEDKIIFNNPFPIISNENQNLVIRNINNLRIKKFDNATGEIIFAKFEPSFLIIMSTPINFDDVIDMATINVTNDSFLENDRVISIVDFYYYKNNDNNDTINVVTNESIPTPNNLNFSWSMSFTFDPISDINENFITFPTVFNFIVDFTDNVSNIISFNKSIFYKSPTFSFTVSSVIKDFRETITSCNLLLNYGNITNKNNNSEIISITSDLPNNPTHSNFTNGMTSYTAENIIITETDIIKTNNLVDNKNYNFTTVCRFTRPLNIDSNQNFSDITSNAFFSVTFTYPIFIGATEINLTDLNSNDIVNLTNVGSVSLPRSFNYTVENDNVNWWFCLRKRYVNDRIPNVTLTSEGITMTTSIIYSNEINIATPNDFETYVCFAIILQANNTYLINISI